MSPRLALHLLGPPQLYLEEKSISFNRRKSLALMAYLAIERGQHRRESLSALLWPDTGQSSAFKNLRQVLWEIQQTLGEGWLITDRETVCLDDNADVWLDVLVHILSINQQNPH
jgi:DNA-binding SARP family transcriptional activator